MRVEHRPNDPLYGPLRVVPERQIFTSRFNRFLVAVSALSLCGVLFAILRWAQP